MARTNGAAAGRTYSVYFKDADKDMRRVRRAAKVRGVRLAVFLREAVMAETERVIAKASRS